jgi:DNA (cytosine-5)-methyltransferase 1
LFDKRGNVFWSCLEIIKMKQPTYFVLENVKGLISHNKGVTWDIMWNLLVELEEDGYTIQWKILNTRDYGIPQNRERLFIVGTKLIFNYPLKIPMNDIHGYIDRSDTSTYTSSGNYGKCIKETSRHNVFIDMAFCGQSKFTNADKYCGCIAYRSNIWNVQMCRYANVKELLSLQGFRTNFINVNSNSQMKKQIGNSMSVNVLQLLLKELLYRKGRI